MKLKTPAAAAAAATEKYVTRRDKRFRTLEMFILASERFREFAASRGRLSEIYAMNFKRATYISRIHGDLKYRRFKMEIVNRVRCGLSALRDVFDHDRLFARITVTPGYTSAR